MAREITSDDALKNRMLKLIPSEIIATYTFTRGVIPEAQRPEVRGWTLMGVTVLLALLTIPTLSKLYGVQNPRQIAFSMVSFVVWVASIGDVVTQLIPGYQGWMGALLLALWSFAVAVLASNYLEPPPPTTAPGGEPRPPPVGVA